MIYGKQGKGRVKVWKELKLGGVGAKEMDSLERIIDEGSAGEDRSFQLQKTLWYCHPFL